MNKIPTFAGIDAGTPTLPSSSPPIRPAMASPDLTPLVPPGLHASPGSSGHAEVPEGRRALFDRALGQVQQKLADRRQAGPDPAMQRHLSVAEHRECDAAAQWVSAFLKLAGSC